MNSSVKDTGSLFIVATPIGNMQDISARALDVLRQVSRVAAEDTRHSRKLLSHFGIGTPLYALHDHNERVATDHVLELLRQGDDVALVSDAGTPLISDPGFYLVRAAHREGFRVVPVPGASALTAALSVAGLPTDRFVFEGFLPSKQAARRKRLQALRSEPRTLVFYESSHRICDCLDDMADVLGSARDAAVAREMTKTFETLKQGTFEQLCDWVRSDSNQQKGEFVVVVHGAPVEESTGLTDKQQQTLEVLMQELPLKQAASLAAKITGTAKNIFYEQGLKLKGDE